MMASRTRGTVSRPRAADSAGTASASPASPRAAAHLLSASGLLSGGRGGVETQVAGPLLPPLTSGMGAYQIDDRGGYVLHRPHHFGATVLYQFARHAPDDGGRLGLGNGTSAALPEPLHGLRAAIAHSRHEHTDQLRGINVFK